MEEGQKVLSGNHETLGVFMEFSLLPNYTLQNIL
jgi:hypothetical protein